MITGMVVYDDYDDDNNWKIMIMIMYIMTGMMTIKSDFKKVGCNTFSRYWNAVQTC